VIRVVVAASVAVALAGVGTAGSRTAAWCGSGEVASDRLPDAVAAQQIHVVYSIPSDGTDRFAEDAPLVVADLEALDAWWQREDPTRVPRFDLYAFPGCSGGLDALDISSVRLPHDTAYYQPIDGRSDRLRADLSGAFANPAKKLLVYYDAPVDTPFDCGQSAIAPDTGALSFVYLQAAGCTHDLGAGGGTAGYVAHELLHNLGAVPDAAPHICFEHSVCDWYWDVEMQFPTGDPIAKLILDYGRDDYYGHPGSWFDVQDSPWLSHVGVPLEELSVAFAGKGRGSVAGKLPGIACPPTCSTGDRDLRACRRVPRRHDPRPRHGHQRAAWDRVPAALLGPLPFRHDDPSEAEGARRLAPRPLLLPRLPRRRPAGDRDLPPPRVRLQMPKTGNSSRLHDGEGADERRGGGQRFGERARRAARRAVGGQGRRLLRPRASRRFGRGT
jgi:hypothetical protein